MAPHNHLINILYWNANGIQHKIHELYELMTNNHIHVACLNETFLKPTQRLYSHPEFKTYRLDRREGRNHNKVKHPSSATSTHCHKSD